MSRRVVLGRVDANTFTIRQSEAGYDALTADLSHILFDADHFPGRVLATGAFFAGEASNWAVGLIDHQTSVPHGLGKAPDYVMATAQPIQGGGGTAPVRWPQKALGANTNLFIESGIDNANMDFRAVTEFMLVGNNTGGAFQTGNGGFYLSGWYYGFDATNIHAWNPVTRPLLVKWAAMEL